MLNYILSKTQLPKLSVQNTIKLLDEDCTIPFISRYRKELTGNLDEVEIGNIVKYKAEFEALEKRKKAILKALEEQSVLTEALKQKVNNCKDLTTLEDLYLPYKKSRKTKAETARKNGLEPLAKIIMSQNARDIENVAYNYIKGDINDVEEALQGARHIIAEWINERTDIRNGLRNQIERHGQIATKVVKSKKDDEKAQKFRDYFNWSESLNRIPSHRFLAISRAEKEGFIKFKLEVDTDFALSKINQRLIKSNNACAEQIELASKDAFKRLLFPSLSNEALQNAKDKADESAIIIFAKNLKQLLLGAPLGEKSVLALDPGFRTGCKLVVLDDKGDLKHHETIYPHAPKNNTVEAKQTIKYLVEKHAIKALAIGNGTASRETESLVRQIDFKSNVEIFVVSEAGASIYSANKIAREEFPNQDVTVRGSISIGRRLQDPLAELVKIDAKSIGVGQYQHDVDQNKLQDSLSKVVENCVNAVGVNINTASPSLLSYVSGIGPKLADNICQYRSENGSFNSRNDINKVPRLGGKAFEQSAGFLRIKSGKNPLDNSSVHPERYNLVKQMAKDIKVSVEELIGNTSTLDKIDLKNYASNDVGLLTLEDIISELKKPGLDIREKGKAFQFNQNIKSITDLEIGQILPGIVNNITAFGCFVDIGIKESGLIHVSNLADTYVKDVNEHVSLHEQISVKVLEVDVTRKRIQLQKL